MFASSFKAPAVLINIVDCTARLLQGQKKDGTFISSLFIPVMESMDQLKDKVDILFFDGGSNFQLAGRIIQARFPRVTVVHGLEHVLSLVFEDIAKIPVVKVSHCISVRLENVFLKCTEILTYHVLFQQLILQVKRLYRCFGSGSNHKPYAFFNSQSKQYNKGRVVGRRRH